MNEETIKALEEQIKQEQKAIALKTVTLKAMKKDSRKYFGQGSLSRGYLNTVRVLTSPFANLNSNSIDKLDTPVDSAAENILKDAATFLKKTQDISTPDNKSAKKACRKAVRHIIKLEEVLANQNLHDSFNPLIRTTITTLKLKVEAIRPPQTVADIAKKEELRSMITNEAEKFMENLAQEQQEKNDDGNSSKSSDSNDSGQLVDIQQAPKQSEEIHSKSQSA